MGMRTTDWWLPGVRAIRKEWTAKGTFFDDKSVLYIYM